MKIFSAAQIKACDAYTIHASSITAADLMETAASQCVAWLIHHLPKDALFVILCGTGNNGGDGLAITRLLHQQGYGVKAFLLEITDSLSPDCNTNLQRLQSIDTSLVTKVPYNTFLTDIPSNVIILDAILGTGLNRPVSGWTGDFITHINQLPNKKIAIDIPSGLPADSIPEKNTPILKAGDTLSFQFYKRTFLHPETGMYAGNVHILPINLSSTFIEATGTQYNITDKEHISSIYHPRSPFSHKGTYGSVLMVGGSKGKTGAITLSSGAALRAGAGLVTVLIPECGYLPLMAHTPEIMCITNGQDAIEAITDWEKYKAIGIGPGIGTDDKTIKALSSFIEQYKQPLVLDADALNILAQQPELLAKLPGGSIITPHPKEFSRLFGDTADSMLRLEMARAQAMRYNIHIVLKDHHTIVVMPDGDCWYNMTGNAGMATGGSGDVLTGIITGLMAQSYSPQDAAVLGVYLHGLAGDIAAEHLSQEALIAGDITEHLGAAFKTIHDEHATHNANNNHI